MIYGTELEEKANCEVYTSFEAIADLRRPWDEFVESVGGDIYQTYDWCRIWWKHYGSHRQLRLFCFRENDRLVGIVPAVIDCVGLRPLRWKLAKPLGSDFTMMMVNPAVLPEYGETVFNRVNEHLLETDRCDLVGWGPMDGGHCLSPRLHFESRSFRRVELKEKTYTVFPLPDTFKAYREQLSPSTRKHFRRDQNYLSERYEVQFRLVDDPAIHFERFVQMHRAQWKKLNKLGHFDDWPDAQSFHRDLAHCHGGLGRLRLFCLRADGEPIVYRYLYRFGKQYHSILPARLCDPPWDKTGLGRMTHILTVEQAIAEGVRVIEAGRGHYGHKLKLGGREYPAFSAVFRRKGRWNFLKARSFCLFSKLLNFVYYKLWFGQVAPRLPFRRTHLWKLWIRAQV
jgi:CelD/BcsL family acetyltransferase involved in cellulose biosynthesis